MSTTQYVDVDRTLANIEDELDPENAQAIRAFIDHCAAEGISEVQQQRHAQSLKYLFRKFVPDGFQLRGASEDELKQIIAAVNRSDAYADASKNKMKSAVKKFYRLQNGGTQPGNTKFFTAGKTGRYVTVSRPYSVHPFRTQ